MKITSFMETAKSGIKVFKPIQYLHIVGATKENVNLSDVKLRARIVSSESGRVEEIIPLVGLDVLGEITSMNEGFFKCFQQATFGKEEFAVNVMLHPTSAVYLSNDKYLEVDIQGLDNSVETSIYGLEMPVIDKNFICRYNKFYMAAGELQKTFAVGDNENLILPGRSFDEVTLHYKNGSSCSYTKAELGAMMMLKNDVVSVHRLDLSSTSLGKSSTTGSGNDQYNYFNMYFGYRSLFGLDVSEVNEFTIRRTSSTESFEFILMDTIVD